MNVTKPTYRRLRGSWFEITKIDVNKVKKINERFYVVKKMLTIPKPFRPKYIEEKDSCDEYLKRFIQRLKFARQIELLLFCFFFWFFFFFGI